MDKGFVKVTIINNLGTHKKGAEVIMHESTAKGCKVNGFVSFGEVTEVKTVKDTARKTSKKK